MALDWGAPYAIFVKDGWVGTVFEHSKGDYSFYPLEQHAKHYLRKIEIAKSPEAKHDAFDDLVSEIDFLEPHVIRGAA
ncbi:hypothetical protein INO28_14155, partial [Staphylococcus aureus]|nr:hypothetical protein [Staphylococcus aureus]